MKDKIVNLVLDKFEKTRCGITPIELMQKLEVSYSEIKPILNELHQEKKIKIREGINQKLIYLTKK